MNTPLAATLALLAGLCLPGAATGASCVTAPPDTAAANPRTPPPLLRVITRRAADSHSPSRRPSDLLIAGAALMAGIALRRHASGLR